MRRPAAFNPSLRVQFPEACFETFSAVVGFDTSQFAAGRFIHLNHMPGASSGGASKGERSIRGTGFDLSCS